MTGRQPDSRLVKGADELLRLLEKPGAMAALNGPPGSGRSTVGRAIASQWTASGHGRSEWITCSRGFELDDAMELVADSFRQAPGHHLLILDDAYNAQPGGLHEFVNRLSTGPWTFSTLLIGVSPEAWPMDVVELAGLSRGEVQEIWQAHGLNPSDIDFDRFVELSRGSPAVINAVLDFQRATQGAGANPLQLLMPWAVGGLFGSDGAAIKASSGSGKRIITDIHAVNAELIRALADQPALLRDLDPRHFEELVAELFARSGYEVELTGATRDGGKDLYVARHDQFGRFMTIVECKRYAADHKVGVSVVRSLYGTAQVERVNAAMVVTTSSFTRDAQDFAERIGYQMTLRDYFHVREWLQSSI